MSVVVEGGRPVVSADPNENWANDAIQCARLLAEVGMTCGLLPWQREAVCRSMDLTEDQLYELFARADAVWDDVKSRTS